MNAKKAPTFRSRPCYYLQFPFVFRRIQSLQLLLSDSPLLSAFASNLSGPSVSRLSPLPFRFLTPSVSAFFRPLQFRVLTTQPLCFLSFSSRFRLTVAFSVRPFRFRFLGSPPSLRPGFPCLPSGFSYSALLFVSFRPSLLRSHSCSTGAYRPLSLPAFSTSDPLPFVCFSSASGYSALCSSFPSLPGSALQLLSRCPPPLSLPRFPPSLRPNLSCLPSGFLYSALLLVSFRSALLRSRSRSTGDPLSDFSSGADA